MKADGRDGDRASSGCSPPKRAPPGCIRRATPSPACAATSCSRARPTRRPAVSTARSGSPSTAPTGSARPAPSTSAAASRRPSPAAASTRSRSPRRATPSYRLHVRGTWGHGSMPREDNAAVLPPRSSARLAVPGPTRMTPVMARSSSSPRPHCPPKSAGCCERLAGGRPGRRRGGPRGRLRPDATRVPSAPSCATRSARTSSTPGSSTTSSRATPSIEVDCRVLPGTTEADIRAELVERLGPELAAACEIELIVFGAPVEAPAEGALSTCSSRRSATTIPTASRCRSWSPSRRTPSTPTSLGVPTYGFSPLRLDPGRALPRTVPRRRRAGLGRRPALGPAGPVRRRPPLLRLSVVGSAGRPRIVRRVADHDLLVAGRAPVERRPFAHSLLGIVVGRVVVLALGASVAPRAVVVPMLDASENSADAIRDASFRAGGSASARRRSPDANGLLAGSSG